MPIENNWNYIDQGFRRTVSAYSCIVGDEVMPATRWGDKMVCEYSIFEVNEVASSWSSVRQLSAELPTGYRGNSWRNNLHIDLLKGGDNNPADTSVVRVERFTREQEFLLAVKGDSEEWIEYNAE